MQSFIAIIFMLTWKSVVGYQEIFSHSVEFCHLYRDVTQDYRISLYEFTAQAYKDIGPNSLYQFVFSPLSAWIILAAIAEGVEPQTQQHMFRFLNLSNDPCVRLKYYELATSRYLPGNDVNIVSTRSLVVDQGLSINPYWHNFVSKNKLIDLVSAPFRYDPQGTLNAIRRLSSASLPNLDLSGNSVLVDVMDYNGLWSTSFSDAVVERSPFYNKLGQVIGAVDLMRVTRPARLAFVPSINGKVLELPIGVNDRYRMLFALVLGNAGVDEDVAAVKSSIITEFISKARDSFTPIDIAIPRFTMTSEIDIRKIMENLGVKDLWTDPLITRYISNPAALPSGFVQRATITLDNHGISPAPRTILYPYNMTTGLEPVLGRDFIANQPFLFGLFDSETYTCIMASIFTQPTYQY